MATYQVNFPKELGSIEPVEEYQSLGYCIYCLRRNVSLRREHIIPHGIAGDAFVFLKASCIPCGNMTGKFEQATLRHAWWPFRTKIGAPASERKKIPKDWTLRNAKLNPITGQPEVTSQRQVSIDEYPTQLVMMRYPEPGVLAGRPHTHKIEGALWYTSANMENFSFPPGAGFQIGRFHPGEFSRMLAKIAHAYASATYRERFKPALRKIIKGNSEFFTYWIGSEEHIAKPEDDLIHKIGHHVAIKDGKTYVIVMLRLFAFMGTPEFKIVAGELRSDDEILLHQD